jgi:hypothetical protein
MRGGWVLIETQSRLFGYSSVRFMTHSSAEAVLAVRVRHSSGRVEIGEMSEQFKLRNIDVSDKIERPFMLIGRS